MSDIERQLHAAVDDSDRPLYISVEDILQRGRRSVRNRRIAGLTTTALVAVTVALGAATTIPALHGVEPPIASQVAGDGTDPATGKKVVPAPPVSPLTDAEILRRCLPGDKESLDFNRTYKANTFDKAGPLSTKWTLEVKSGVGEAFTAIFVSPDRSIAATCHSAGFNPPLNGAGIVDRVSTTGSVASKSLRQKRLPMAQLIKAPDNVKRVLFVVAGEKVTREALMSKNSSFYAIGWPTQDESKESVKVQIRGYDAKGDLVFNAHNYHQAQRIPPLS